MTYADESESQFTPIWFSPTDWLVHGYLDQPTPIKSGIPALDNMLNDGFQPGVWCIMAEPGAGKSAFGLQLVLAAAMKGFNAAYISLEMPAHQCWSRIVSEYSYHNEYEDKFKWSDVPRMGREAAAIYGGNRASILDSDDLVAHTTRELERRCPGILITDTPNARNLDTLTGIIELANVNGAGIVVVDYMQQITTAPGAKAYDRVSEVSAALKDTANMLKIPIVVIVSMNRESMRGKEPDMHGGSGSASIEYDAVGIMTLKKIEDKSTKDCRRVELKLQKNRYGYAGGSVMLDYWPAYNVFYEAPKTIAEEV